MENKPRVSSELSQTSSLSQQTKSGLPDVRLEEFLKCDFYREDFYNFCVYVLEDLEIFSNNFQSFLHMRTDWKGALRIAFNSFAIISKIHGQG